LSDAVAREIASTAEGTLEIDFRHPTGGRTEFFFVRHGRTEGNVRRMLVGRTDIPLDELGVRQAVAVAEHFAASTPPDVIITSPLIRARATAEAIAKRISLPIEVEEDLAELNFGTYEGKSFDDLIMTDPEFAARFLDYEFDAQWPGGERLSEFHDRVRRVVTSLATQYASHTAIVVAHGGVLGSLASQLLGTPPNDWSRYQFKNCSVTHLELSSERSVLHRLNDVAHLVSIELEEHP
jgi:broad specificity phosphatase PhoE